MTIKNKLDEIGLSLVFFSEDDWSTYQDIDLLIENISAISSLVSNLDCEINNHEDFENYYYIDYLKKLVISKINIKEEAKQSLENIKKIILQTHSKFKKDQINSYLKQEYKTIFSKKKKGLFDIDIIEFSIAYCLTELPSEDEIINEIINNYSYCVFDNYNLIKNGKDSICESLFSAKTINENIDLRLDTILDILKNDKSINKKTTIIDNLCQVVKDKYFSPNLEENPRMILMSYTIVNNTYELLKKIENKNAYDFEKELAEQKTEFEHYFVNNSQVFKREIDITDIMKHLNNSKTNYVKRFYYLTNLKDDKTGNVITLFEEIFEHTDYDPLDSITSEFESIPRSQQERLEKTMMTLSFVMRHVINDENLLSEYMNHIGNTIANSYDRFGINYDEKLFEQDINMLICSIQDLLLLDLKNYTRVSYYLHSSISFILKLIEKFFRILEKGLSANEKYINDNHLMLNAILNTESKTGKFLGESNIKGFKYYLLTSIEDKNGNIGLGLRNNFMHYNNCVYEMNSFENLYLSLALLLLLANTLFLKEI